MNRNTRSRTLHEEDQVACHWLWYAIPLAVGALCLLGMYAACQHALEVL